jgi:hypothetical protein
MRKTHLVKIVVEHVVYRIKILGEYVEGLANRCKIEESHGAAHHCSEG